MLNEIKYLESRIDSLELAIKNETKNQVSSSNAVSYFKNNYLYIPVINRRRVTVAKIESSKGTTVFVSVKIGFNNSSSQKIQVVLIANGASLTKTSQTYSAGYNEITLNSPYTVLSSNGITLKVEIYPESLKYVLFESVNITVWGGNTQINDYEYGAINAGSNNYLLSQIDNDSLYYKTVTLNESSLFLNDFTYYSKAKSHSFAFLSSNNKTYLFRVSTDGYLFYCDFDSKNETYITSGVSKVSATSSTSTIYISYIKNNACYTMEFQNGIFSIPKKVSNLNQKFISCLVFYNNLNSTLYLLLTNSNNHIYLLEALFDVVSKNSTLSVEFEIQISTY